MYILQKHNLKEKDFHEPRTERILSRSDGKSHWQYIWVDKGNGRFHISSSIKGWWTEPNLFLTFHTSLYDNERAPVKRQIRNDNAGLPDKYQSVVTFKIEPLDRSKVDKLVSKVELTREDYGSSFFAIEPRASLATITMPKNIQENDSKHLLNWITYSVLPLEMILPKDCYTYVPHLFKEKYKVA